MVIFAHMYSEFFSIYKNMWNFPQEFLWYCQPNIFVPLKTNNDSITWSYLAVEKPTLCCFLLCLSGLTQKADNQNKQKQSFNYMATVAILEYRII